MGPEGERSMTDEERRWLSQLRWIRRACDWAHGWVKHTFAARFGFVPESLGSDPMTFPDDDVYAFVQDKVEAFLVGQGIPADDVERCLDGYARLLARWQVREEREAVEVAQLREPRSAAPGPKVHLRVTALSSACTTRAEAPIGPYVATDDLSEVTCLRCRRSELWREALKDPSEIARYRPHCEAYEEAIRADRARFFAERASDPAAVAAPAPRVVPVCHMLDGGDDAALIDEEDQG